MARLALPEHADSPVVERGPGERAGTGHALNVGADLRQHVQDDVVQQVVLAAEVAVQRRRSDRDGVGDARHRHLSVAVARKQLGSGGHDQAPPVARSRAAACRSERGMLSGDPVRLN